MLVCKPASAANSSKIPLVRTKSCCRAAVKSTTSSAYKKSLSTIKGSSFRNKFFESASLKRALRASMAKNSLVLPDQTNMCIKYVVNKLIPLHQAMFALIQQFATNELDETWGVGIRVTEDEQHGLPLGGSFCIVSRIHMSSSASASPPLRSNLNRTNSDGDK
jgi:hypothetical protein